MAEIHKIEKNGVTIYPATTTDAVVDKERRETIKVSIDNLIQMDKIIFNSSVILENRMFDLNNGIIYSGDYDATLLIPKLGDSLKIEGAIPFCFYYLDENKKYNSGNFNNTGKWIENTFYVYVVFRKSDNTKGYKDLKITQSGNFATLLQVEELNKKIDKTILQAVYAKECAYIQQRDGYINKTTGNFVALIGFITLDIMYDNNITYSIKGTNGTGGNTCILSFFKGNEFISSRYTELGLVLDSQIINDIPLGTTKICLSSNKSSEVGYGIYELIPIPEYINLLENRIDDRFNIVNKQLLEPDFSELPDKFNLFNSPMNTLLNNGNFYTSIQNKEIQGLSMKINKDGVIYYGLADVDNDSLVVSNFSDKGSFNVKTNNEIYTFESPIYVNENQMIYVRQKETQTLFLQNKNSYDRESPYYFLTNFNNNKLNKSFVAAYVPIISIKEQIENQENRISSIEESLIQKKETLVGLGGSVAYGIYGGSDPSSDDPELRDGKSFNDYLAEMIGVDCVKYAFSGASIWNNLKSQIDLIQSAGYITICMGVNDIGLVHTEGSNVIIGEAKDIIYMNNNSPEEPLDSTLYNNSILGRFRWCLEFLKNKFPKTNIICIMPPPVNWNGENKDEKMNDFKKLKLGEEVISRFLNIMVVNLEYNSPIFELDYFKQYYYDGYAHPGSQGQKMIASEIFYRFIF